MAGLTARASSPPRSEVSSVPWFATAFSTRSNQVFRTRIAKASAGFLIVS